MTEMIDYLHWWGDLSFGCVPPNAVDMLIFSILAYIRYDGILSENLLLSVPTRTAAKAVLTMPDVDKRCRVSHDLELLKEAAQTERFGNVSLSFYRNIFIREEDTQFAAITYLWGNGTACLSFRGTDGTLVGWKEDFNMTFQESVPSQRLALEYVQEFAEKAASSMYLTGHSKGGNLAVYAAAKCSEIVKNRIVAVYNQDGPGFREPMMTDPGYLAMVPKIRTYVPQSSVIRMLLDHMGAYTVIKSNQVGILQHDPHT